MIVVTPNIGLCDSHPAMPGRIDIEALKVALAASEARAVVAEARDATLMP